MGFCRFLWFLVFSVRFLVCPVWFLGLSVVFRELCEVASVYYRVSRVFCGF